MKDIDDNIKDNINGNLNGNDTELKLPCIPKLQLPCLLNLKQLRRAHQYHHHHHHHHHHPYIHEGECIAHDCQCGVTLSNDKTCQCPHREQKCSRGYRYWCIECGFGMNGMYSKCYNNDCVRYNKMMFDD